MQGEGSPYAAFGLLQHETRLSVLNFAIKKAANFTEPLQNKTSLLFAAGCRSSFCEIYVFRGHVSCNLLPLHEPSIFTCPLSAIGLRFCDSTVSAREKRTEAVSNLQTEPVCKSLIFPSSQVLHCAANFLN